MVNQRKRPRHSSKRVRRRLTAGTTVAILSAGSLAFAATQTPSADLAFGEYLSAECMTCHRPDGKEQGIPSIVGWAEDNFVEVMRSYRDRVRPNPIMQTVAGKLSDQEIRALAAYLATLKPS